ncbi:MAG TPA: hypothetical protein VGI40_23905 [Pirellulaceae bacterium]|jgi:hypothetical protein
MALTKSQVEKLPDVYRDFMLTLAPVLRSKQEGAVMQIKAVPFSFVCEAVGKLHDYHLAQVRELRQNLKAKGYITEDKFGFLSPTDLGEEVIRLLDESVDEPVVVPPLPDLN